MPLHVAFLRGMNLGRRRIKNAELCSCFERLGFDDVSAFLASGNVIFRARAVSEAKIAKGLSRELDYDVPVFVRSASEVAAIAECRPFSSRIVSKTAKKLQVALLQKKPSANTVRSALALGTDDDHLKLEGREMYWLPRSGISDSELDLKRMERLLGPMTIRTHRTILRLGDKLA